MGDLAERFKVKKEDFPVVILFKVFDNGKIAEKHRFDGDFKADNIKTFIRQKSGIYLPRPGCVEEFDNLADRLMTLTDSGSKGKIIVEAETIKENLNEDKAKRPRSTSKSCTRLSAKAKNLLTRKLKE